MKHLLLALVAVVAFSVVSAPQARAQSMDRCQHEPTVQSLRACVQHAAAQGFITNRGVTHSLLAKLYSAQEAVERNQPGVAVKVLGAFIHEVEAQAGRHIQAEQAQHLVEHAQFVIQALKTT